MPPLTRPASAIDFFVLGAAAFGREDFEQAGASFRQALQQEPDHFWAQFLLALCHLELEQPEQAEIGLTACLGRRPDFPWTYLFRGFARSLLNALPEAEADFRAADLALQRDEKPGARFLFFTNRGVLRWKQQRLAEAAADLEQAVALRSNQFRPRVNLAGVYAEQGKGQEAVRQLDAAIELAPNDRLLSKLHTERGRMLVKGKRFAEALADYDAALKRRPDYAAAHGLRAQLLLQQKDYQGAVQAFDQYFAKERKPDPGIYRLRGSAHMNLGNYLAAIHDYTLGLGSQPTADSYVQRGWAYFF